MFHTTFVVLYKFYSMILLRFNSIFVDYNYGFQKSNDRSELYFGYTEDIITQENCSMGFVF